MSIWHLGVQAVERGLVPDTLTRAAIRRLCHRRLQSLYSAGSGGDSISEPCFIATMRSSPIALVPEKANEQHYELPPEFFELVLGPRLKYSCCFWPHPHTTLAEAEVAALETTCLRAELADGQRVLELGCGWGSLSLWMAQHYPASRITAVSNSVSQRTYIETAAAARKLTNLTVVTADMNDFIATEKFDRVISIEMFEHMRNYELLLQRISDWLRPQGKLFIHIFCHRETAYPFDSSGDADWMGRLFFSGGLMPSLNLLSNFSRDMQVERSWCWNGLHYQRTAEAWLALLDERWHQALTILRQVYGPSQGHRWLQRWRVFFMAVSELFGYRDGDEWLVAHYLMRQNDSRSAVFSNNLNH